MRPLARSNGGAQYGRDTGSASGGMAGIFISYRRADSDGWAGRLRDALRVRFGDIVFQDVDNIADGEIFSDVIDRALQACDVALVIIGPTWANARDEQGRRRLDLEDDWVRTETAMVLERRIRVIPVLVGGARLPRAEELPEELRSLTKRQAREIRSTSWDSDVALLASHLQQIVGHPHRRLWVYAVPAVLVAGAIGVFVGSRFFGPPETRPSTREEVALAPADEKGRGFGSPGGDAARAARPGAEKRAESTARADAKPPVNDSGAPAKPASPFSSRADAQGRYDPRIDLMEAQPQRPAKERAAEVQTSKPVVTKKPDAVLVEAPAPTSKPAVTKKPDAALVEAPAPTPTPARAKKADAALASQAAPRVDPRPPAAPAADTPRAEVAVAPAAGVPSTARSEPSRPPDSATDTVVPSRGAPTAAPDTGVTASTIARVVPINLPNRSPAARELRIGDSWTYRFRELAYNRDSVTVTHEVRGGDANGIREIVRSGARKSEEAGGTQRRLALEPRVFEQQIEASATLFEFAPFLAAFSDVRPGLAWKDIAVPQGADDWRLSGKVTGRERVRTPAGTFDAIKAELEGRRELTFPSTRDVYYETIASRLAYSIWYVPEIGRAVKYERRTFNRASRLLEHEQYELVSYQLQ